VYPNCQVLQWSVQGGEIVGIPKPLTKDFLLQGIIQARDDETCGGFHGCASRSHRNSVKVRAADTILRACKLSESTRMEKKHVGLVEATKWGEHG